MGSYDMELLIMIEDWCLIKEGSFLLVRMMIIMVKGLMRVFCGVVGEWFCVYWCCWGIV